MRLICGELILYFSTTNFSEPRQQQRCRDVESSGYSYVVHSYVQYIHGKAIQNNALDIHFVWIFLSQYYHTILSEKCLAADR